MFKRIPIILTSISLLTVIVIGAYIPLYIKQLLYTISFSIKSFIIMVLPFIIFGLLFKSASTLSKRATTIIGFLLLLVCISNFISTFLSQFIGRGIYNSDLSIILSESLSSLLPLWSIKLPQIISNDKAMILGIVSGIIFSRFWPTIANTISLKIEIFVNIILKIIISIVPLFIIGFVIKIQHDGLIDIVIKSYIKIFIAITVALFCYILSIIFIFSKGNIKILLKFIQNLSPAILTASSTMSSAAAMPLTIIGAKKNIANKDLTNTIIPVTVNIHLIGDCFAIPILAYAILKSFGMVPPTYINYLIFTFYFVIAKFSVAAVPGGGILVMLPILEKYFHFNSEMLSMITTLYILFDPIITGFNVFGNGVFAKVVDILVPFEDVSKI